MISLFVSNSDPKNTSNNGSQVTLALNPAVMLNPDKKYYASAVEVDIVFCFANIFTGVNDKFVYKEMKGGILTTFTHIFSQGLYSVSAIQDEINRITQGDVQNSSLFILEPDTSTSHIFIHFRSTTCKLDCSGADNIMQILGYPASTGLLDAVAHVNDFYEGNNAQLNNVQNVLLLASFVNGSYKNEQSQNVLCSITPDVGPYSTIQYRPNLNIYVPVTQQILDTISFSLVDQTGKPINMGYNNPGDTVELWSARIVIVEENKVKA